MTSEEREYIIEKRELYEDIIKKADKIIMVTVIVGIGGAVLQEVAPGILNADAYSTACEILEPVKKLGFSGLFTSMLMSLKYIGRKSELVIY